MPSGPTRREVLQAATAAAVGSGLAMAGAEPKGGAAADKVLRIGVVSASIRGKPQPRNGHTWHFAQYLHPTVNLDAIKKYLDPGSADDVPQVPAQPEVHLRPAALPRHEDHALLRRRPEGRRAVHRGVSRREGGEVAGGDGRAGRCRLDGRRLGLRRGPLRPGRPRPARRGCRRSATSRSAAPSPGTRKILDFARQHKAPLMSSSLFRHEWGTEAALRKRDSGEFGPIQYVIASVQGGYSPGRLDDLRPAPGLDGDDAAGARRRGGQHVRPREHLPRPGHLHGPHAGRDLVRPAERGVRVLPHGGVLPEEDATSTRRRSRATSGTATTTRCSAWPRRSARWSRRGKEPIPHQEILEVTAIVHAAAKSLKEKSRLVELAEVMA